MALFKLLALCLLILVAVVSLASAQPGKRRGRGVPIDELLERAVEEMSERRAASSIRAGNQGKGRGRGPRFTRDGKATIVELDIADPIPEEEPAVDVIERRSGNNGNGRGRRRRPNKARGKRQKRNAMINTSRYWTSKVIPYTMSGTFTQSEIDTFQEAIAEYNKYTCINWVPRGSQTNYVSIIRNGGCYSYIGKIGGGQTMSLGSGCLNAKRTAIHEMMHALGVFHQHTRPDRDSFVTINYGNIDASRHNNFNIKSVNEVNDYGTDYSYLSVMHYGRKTFSNNGLNTITTQDSSAQNIIGTVPTFGYEDIELITRMYSCNATCQPAICPPGAFQGHDCNCYCKTTDPQNPAANCGEVCIQPNQECTCNTRTNACSGISDSSCNPASGACECNSGYVSHNNVCTLITSISCAHVGEDCKCSLTTDLCPSGIPNSVCDTATNACLCEDGSAPNENGGCTDITSVSCNNAGIPCYCTYKGTTACAAVSDSVCDLETDSCKCNVDYFNNNGDCATVQACDTLNEACHCSVQGSDACISISNTICDTVTDSCKCDTSTHEEVNGVCVNANQFISDGSSVTPFTASSISTTNFAPVMGSDSGSFSIASNNYYLFASGTGGTDVAAFETELIQVPGTWCVELSYRLSNAYIYTEYSYNGINYGYTGRYTSGTMTNFQDRPLFRRTANTQIKFRIRARPNNNAAWSVALDPVKIYLC